VVDGITHQPRKRGPGRPKGSKDKQPRKRKEKEDVKTPNLGSMSRSAKRKIKAKYVEEVLAAEDDYARRLELLDEFEEIAWFTMQAAIEQLDEDEE
jgi:hypothetical protein